MERSRSFGALLIASAAALALSIGIALAALPPGGTFTDDNGNVHEGNIEAIAAVGITKGCGAAGSGLYCPASTVTRGQMAAFLNRALNLPATGTDFFTDDNGTTFEDDINRLAAAGITKGCGAVGSGMYCPNGQVTRGQMAAFIVRAFGYTDDGGGDLFTDDDGSVFEPEIDRLGTAGVTKGCNPPTNDQFCPSSLVRRDQMASFLARALELTPIVPPPPTDAGEMSVVFVAVRQGDAAIYQGACGEVGVIDVNRFRAADVLTALDTHASRNLKWMASSHYDADHLGGVLNLATSAGVSVGTFYDRGGSRTVKDSNTYRDYYDHVTSTGKRNPVDIGDTFTLCTGPDQITFTVISQGTDGTAIGGVAVSEENDRGLCIHVEYHGFDLATCGDINGTGSGSRTDIETPAAAAIGDVEVVNVNHHGSSYSSNQIWVNTMRAEVAVFSVGKNGFGHPSGTIISRWQTSGADTYQTNSTTVSTAKIDGNIEIRTTGTGTFSLVAVSSGRSGTYPIDP